MKTTRSPHLLALAAAALFAAPIAAGVALADDPKADAPSAAPAPTAPARPAAGPAENAPPAGDTSTRPGRPGPGSGVPGAATAGRTIPGSIEQGMKLMDRSLRGLKGQAGDPAKKDDNLRLVSDFQRGCLGCKAAPTDGITRKTEGAKKDEVVTSFRKGVIKLLAKSTELESAILEGRAEDAARVITEMEAIQATGHKDFGVRERNW